MQNPCFILCIGILKYVPQSFIKIYLKVEVAHTTKVCLSFWIHLIIYSQNIIKTNFMLARNWENVSKQNTGEFYLENLFLKRSTFYLHLQSSIPMNLIMNQNQVDDNTLKFPYSTFSLLSYLQCVDMNTMDIQLMCPVLDFYHCLSSDSKVMTIQGLEDSLLLSFLGSQQFKCKQLNTKKLCKSEGCIFQL